MSPTNSSAPTLDLARLFQLENPAKFNKVTCLTYADSKGRRCQNPIALSNRVAAMKLLKDLSVFEPGEILESETLLHRLELAVQFCLCRNVHWNRVDKFEEVVDEWKDILEREQEQLDQQTEDEGEHALQAEEDSDSDLEADWDSGYESNSLENDFSPRRPLDSMPRTSAIDSFISFSELPSPPNTPPRNREDSSNTESNEDVEEIETPASHPSRFEWPPSSDTPFSWSPPSPPSTSAPSTSPIPPASPSPREPHQSTLQCTQTHVARRAADDDCPICTTAMASTPLEELVWCKARCGRSVHKTCFEQWESHRGDDVTCVYCRAVWAGHCAHDVEPPSIL